MEETSTLKKKVSKKKSATIVRQGRSEEGKKEKKPKRTPRTAAADRVSMPVKDEGGLIVEKESIAPDSLVKEEAAAAQTPAAESDSTAASLIHDKAMREEAETRVPGKERYFEAVGRRKTAIARVRLFTKPGDFSVNEKLYSLYFSTVELQRTVEDALKKMKLFGRFRVSVKASGGGTHAQAEAVRHGLARCLVKFNPDFRKRLKRAGFLRRDPRMKERKKFGLKKARRAPQWQKR